jgi:hypothetical protein
VLAGMIEIHDLDGSREYFLRSVPDPFCTVAHDLA